MSFCIPAECSARPCSPALDLARAQRQERERETRATKNQLSSAEYTADTHINIAVTKRTLEATRKADSVTNLYNPLCIYRLCNHQRDLHRLNRIISKLDRQRDIYCTAVVAIDTTHGNRRDERHVFIILSDALGDFRLRQSSDNRGWHGECK